MAARPSFLVTVVAVVVALLCMAPTNASRAESHRPSLRSLVHRYAPAYRQRHVGAELLRPIAADDDDDSIADDDAAFDVSADQTPSAIVDFPTLVSHASDAFPALEYSDAGAPRAPPGNISA